MIALRRAAGKITKRREADKDLPQPHFMVHQLVIEEKKNAKSGCSRHNINLQ